ncbi:MAG: propionate--CoA ligase [Verrucomicrobia bacterium]|nr:propionate--CoA ligase [Verrucomicrobiota bacterium]
MSKPSPSREFIRRSLSEPEAFWTEQAQAIHWQTPFRQACDFSRPPFAKWFSGGTTNLSYNAVDRHVPERGDQAALSFYSTEVDQEKNYTYRDLHREVQTFAGALQGLGVKRGDRVIIYLPMIPEAFFAMLACARLGAIHSVVFAGFAPASLATRIDDAEAKLLITADAAMRGGKLIPLKQLADDAIRRAQFPPARVVVCDRGLDGTMPFTPPRDVRYADLRTKHAGEVVPPVWLESNELSYLLYTSGTTATPKGIPRDTGGYAVALSLAMQYIFAGVPGETMFTAADIGWAVGHSFGVYGPLLHGMNTVLYEGLPVRPDGGIWWKIVEKYRATVMFTSPTAIRVLKRQDPGLLRRYDTSSLQRLFLAGEPLDVPTWEWISNALEIPVIDNYWQTETGWPVLTLLPGIEAPKIKPGSPGVATPGYATKIVEPATGTELPRGEKGFLALELPLPPGCMPTVWRNDEMFSGHYCGRFPDRMLYSTFDYAIQDEDGYIFLLGRSDDVINVAGHRLGTREIEETICRHLAVAEAAAVGVQDSVKGQVVHCFVVLKPSTATSAGPEEIQQQIGDLVVKELGAFSRPSAVYIVGALPKTRSGKVLRRAILAAAEGRPTGDLSTLEDPVALDSIRNLVEVVGRSAPLKGTGPV